MGLNYTNLNETTRRFMLIELDRGGHFISPRLTESGRTRWTGVLKDAIQYHTDVWLERELVRRNFMLGTETLKSPMGGKTLTRAINKEQAAKTLAEGEFNRYYLRGLCLAAQSRGYAQIVVCAGKMIPHASPDLQKAIGKALHIEALLENLRSANYTRNDALLGAPIGSGLSAFLSARLPQAGDGIFRRAQSAHQAAHETVS